MSRNRKIVHRIILFILLIWTAILVYSIVKNPLGSHNVISALIVAAGFIALEHDKKHSACSKENR